LYVYSQFLKAKQPLPVDNPAIMTREYPKRLLWGPIRRYDISWNFEKFLIDATGCPVRRYSPYCPMAVLANDVQELIEEAFIQDEKEKMKRKCKETMKKLHCNKKEPHYFSKEARLGCKPVENEEDEEDLCGRSKEVKAKWVATK
jgi:hypothetical protein